MKAYRARSYLRYAAVAPCLLVSIVALAFVSCAAKEEAKTYLPSDYTAWRRTTDVVLDYPIPGHEDHFRVIKMNETGFGIEPRAEDGRRRWEFPEGTIIVKEIFEGSKPVPAESPVMLTAMVKAPADPRARGGWLWITKDLAANKESVITGSFCVNCHGNANEAHPYGSKNVDEEFSDYVFFIPLKASASKPAAVDYESGY